MYVYDAITERVVDGDTVRVLAQNTLYWPDETILTNRSFIVRLLELDTPEMDDKDPQIREAAQAATAYVRSVLFKDGLPVELKLWLTGKRDVYGRWLGYLYIPDHEMHLASMIIAAKLGKYVRYANHISRIIEEVRDAGRMESFTELTADIEDEEPEEEGDK